MNTKRLKKIFVAALMAICSSGAMAWTPEWWGFSWKGLIQYDGHFDPNDIVNGWFTGQDANHDNKIELNELTGLEIAGLDFYSCTPQSGAVSTCSISAFSYEIGGAMNFTATRNDFWNHIDSFDSRTLTYVAGAYIELVIPKSGSIHVLTKQFSPLTETAVSSAPEPETYAMLCTGLALLAGIHARKKRPSV